MPFELPKNPGVVTQIAVEKSNLILQRSQKIQQTTEGMERVETNRETH